jgi:hypothetical protein
VVLLEITAYNATQHLLLSVAPVVASHWTRGCVSTLRQLIFRIFANVVSIALPLVAGFTEVCISPTKPLGNTAAEFAFELDKVLTVLWAIFYRDLAAIRADEFLRIKGGFGSLSLIHGGHTILSAPKIRVPTLEAHEIGIYDIGVLLRLSKIR